VERTNFEKLAVYQLAERLGDDLCQIVRCWAPLDRDTVGKQLLRAADSIGANIAEGVGRGTYQENRRFVRIARGPSTKPSTGSAAPSNAIYLETIKRRR
jgi:hypothetical protein